MTLVIRSNAATVADVLIPDTGVVVPQAGDQVTLIDQPSMQTHGASADLRALATDDAFGVGDSTLILNDGSGDVAQADVDAFLANVALANATETVPGVGRVATQAEADGGTDDTVFLTPLKLASSFLGSIPLATQEPTGFEDPFADITIAWSDVTKILTVAPTGASFALWQQGVKFTKTTETKDISATIAEGFWFFYYDTAGVLQASQTPWNFDNTAQVAILYWDATNAKALMVGWEAHRLVMDWATHKYLHETVGTRFDNGLTTSGTIVGDGSLEADAQIAVGSGEIHDEDIEIIITQGVGGARFEQDLATPAKIPVWYLNGATPVWRADLATSFPVKQGTARIAYNLNTAGTWTHPDVTNNGNFVAYWLFATNDQTQPVIAIMGQRQDGNLADAQDNNTLESLNLASLELPEMKVLARLIFQTSTAYANTPHARLRDILDLRRVQDLPTGAFVPTDHNSLSGRSSPNAHPASAIQVGTTNFNGGLSAADSDGQTALETIDDKLLTAYAERIVQFSYTGTVNFQQVLRLTTASIPAGDYIVHWYLTLSSDDENKFVQFRCQVDDTTNVINPSLGYLERSLPKANNGADIAQSGFRKVTLTAAVHTIDIDVALTDAGKVVYVEQASIFLRRA